MLDLPLSASEYAQYLAALSESHAIRIQVSILDHDEKSVGSLTAPASKVIDGAVQFDASQPISRSLELTALDPGGKLAFDPNSPAQGALYAAFLVAVRYGVYVAAADEWVDVPVFRGPLTRFSHQGGVVSIEASGKEALMLDPYFVTEGYTIHKGTQLDDAIKHVGRKAGETRFDIPRFPHRRVRPHNWIVQPGDEPWKIIVGEDGTKGLLDTTGKKKDKKKQDHRDRRLTDLTGSDPHEAFYNGRGRLVFRRLHKSPTFRFDTDWLVTWPNVSYDLLNFRNWVRVKGGKAKGAKHPVTGTAQLRSQHPLSPHSLRRNGVPGRIALFADAANLTRQSEVNERAKKLLDHHSLIGAEASFEALPVPHLEENDIVTVETEGEGVVHFAMKQFTLPLNAAAMSVGSNRRVRRPHGHRPAAGTVSDAAASRR